MSRIRVNLKADFNDFKKGLEQATENIKAENAYQVEQLRSNLERFGTFSKTDWIEGNELFDFIRNNWYMNGKQLFEVVNKETGDRFLANYYATENSFVNPLNDEEWFYNKESDWENQLNDYKAIPVFINYKPI